MSFLLDTDICSAYLKNHPTVVGKVMLHFGALEVTVVTLGELLTWAKRAKAPPDRLQGVQDFMKELPFSKSQSPSRKSSAKSGLVCWIKDWLWVRWIC